jgi:hypothetical protein
MLVVASAALLGASQRTKSAMRLNDPSEAPGWEKVTRHGLGRGVYLQKGLALSNRVYRYMSAARFADMLRTSQFSMRNVRHWTDPYETWWCEQLFHRDSRLHDVKAFGVCWSRRFRDEPFWRLYEDRCDHKDAQGGALPPSFPPVRIKSRIASIVSLLSKEVDRSEATDTFITSDRPVSIHHPDRQTAGFGTADGMIFFPLSPTRLLIMDDRRMPSSKMTISAKRGVTFRQCSRFQRIRGCSWRRF